MAFDLLVFESKLDADDWAVGGFTQTLELWFEVFEELDGFFVVVVVCWDLGVHEEAGGDALGFFGIDVFVVFFFKCDLSILGLLDVFFPCWEYFFVDGPCFLVFGVGVVLCVDHHCVVFGDIGFSGVEAGGEGAVGDEDEEGEGCDGAADVAEGAPVEGAFAFGCSAEEFGDFLWCAEALDDLFLGAAGI